MIMNYGIRAEKYQAPLAIRQILLFCRIEKELRDEEEKHAEIIQEEVMSLQEVINENEYQ